MNNDLLTLAVKWLNDQTAGLEFGEVGIKIIVHGGRITRIEKQFTEKEQAEQR